MCIHTQIFNHYFETTTTNKSFTLFRKKIYPICIQINICFYLLFPVQWNGLHSLSADLHRVIGHTMCLESPDIQYVQDFLRNEPIIKMLTSSKDEKKNEKNAAAVGDLTNIPLYRWRQIRDYSLRIDDGRFGYPCMCVALDYQPVDNEEEALE